MKAAIITNVLASTNVTSVRLPIASINVPVAKAMKAIIRNFPFNRISLLSDLRLLRANKIPVIPNTSISYIHKDRIESSFAMKRAGLLVPFTYMGYINTLNKQLQNSIWNTLL